VIPHGANTSAKNGKATSRHDCRVGSNQALGALAAVVASSRDGVVVVP
jgi:hypothetical protein